MRRRAKPTLPLARKLLRAKGDKLEFLRERTFHLDEEAAHDDELHERLCKEYSADVDRLTATAQLTVQAEFAGWELARVLLFPDGTRKVTLRRPVSPRLPPAPSV